MKEESVTMSTGERYNNTILITPKAKTKKKMIAKIINFLLPLKVLHLSKNNEKSSCTAGFFGDSASGFGIIET
jgi:ATP-dependent phosphoenolpyruvate carboxykinase